MYRMLQNEKNLELVQLVQSVADQDDDVIIKVLKPFLRSRYMAALEAFFNPQQTDWLLKHSIDKMHPVYAALLNYSQFANFDELVEVFRENLPEDGDYLFPPRDEVVP